jgi:hypothetical protein
MDNIGPQRATPKSLVALKAEINQREPIMKTKYKQCGLQKKTNNGYISQVSWIPTKYAILNQVLKLKDENDKWEDGWKITTVGTEVIEEVPDLHKAVRMHRKATGDSMKKNE